MPSTTAEQPHADAQSRQSQKEEPEPASPGTVRPGSPGPLVHACIIGRGRGAGKRRSTEGLPRIPPGARVAGYVPRFAVDRFADAGGRAAVVFEAGDRLAVVLVAVDLLAVVLLARVLEAAAVGLLAVVAFLTDRFAAGRARRTAVPARGRAVPLAALAARLVGAVASPAVST